MKILGITGPTGSGKSLLCQYLRDMGIHCIDADKVYHSMLIPPSECLDALRLAFGDEIFAPDGMLDRSQLGKIVFSSPEKLELLNSTVLKRVIARINDMLSELEKQGASTVAIDAPTLIESGFHKECDAVISVLADQHIRQNRIIERDAITKEKAELRINAQKHNDFYLENSDFVIYNNGDPKKFESDIISLLAKAGIK